MAAPETGSLAAAMASEFAEPEVAAVAAEFPDLGFSISREWIDSGLEESMLLFAFMLLPAGAGVGHEVGTQVETQTALEL